MNDYINKLNELVALNRIEQLIKLLLETINEYSVRSPEKIHEITELKSQIILLSARYNDTSEKINSGVIDSNHAQTAKNQVLSAFISLINNLHTYESLKEYLKDIEEQKLWEIAVSANTIVAYKTFFEKYPEGKYKEETQRLITQLEEINKKNENEIKRKAQEEKEWRENEVQKEKTHQNSYIIYGQELPLEKQINKNSSEKKDFIYQYKVNIEMRIMAWIIDMIISIVFGFAFIPIFLVSIVFFRDITHEEEFIFFMSILVIILVIILTLILKYTHCSAKIFSIEYLLLYIPLMYYFMKDGYSFGQSYGKKLMGLMVVFLPDNNYCTKLHSFLRNLVMLPLLISSITGFGVLIPLIYMIYTIQRKQGQRIGDLVARTQVINAHQYQNQ